MAYTSELKELIKKVEPLDRSDSKWPRHKAVVHSMPIRLTHTTNKPRP